MFNAIFKRGIHRPNHPRRDGRRLSLEPLETRTLLAVTPQLIDLNPDGASAPSDLVTVGDFAYFVADDGTHGRELWRTDGTSGGTTLVKDIYPGTYVDNDSNTQPNDSGIQELTNFNGTLFFAANDGTNGQELWKSDGTTAGTVMVKDINSGEGYQSPYGDGPLQSFPRNLTVVDGLLLFTAEDATNGVELWKSDGTTSGTVLVKDIYTGTSTDNYGTYPNDSTPRDLVNVDGTLFFSADDGEVGRELWKSDGTAAGTVLVKDINPGTYPYYSGGTYYGQYQSESRPGLMTAVGGTLYFVAQDDTNGAELWKSDGTSAGTELVKDINFGTGHAFSDDSLIVEVNGTLFFTADDGVYGDELWKSDGTTAGTVMVKDIESGTEGRLSYYGDLMEVDGTLFFPADNGSNGKELWKTDGTATGTVMLKDINTGTSDGYANSSYPFYMANIDGTLYFSAATADEGRELWRSDGTAAGTVLVADMVSGTTGLYPTALTSVNGSLVFVGDDGSGSELWSLDTQTEEQGENARLTIFVDSEQVTIPVNVGMNADDSTASVFTTDNAGAISFDSASSPTLGDFFDIWRTDAGLAGNNSDAVFSADELLGNDAGAGATIQMFVNGEISTDFEQHLIQPGDEIVLVFGANPVVSLNTNFGSIVIELFEEQTPITVDNFLNYINDGDYIGTFFHRSDPGFVIQGGGYATTSTTYTNTDQFYAIQTDSAIVNESGISNLQGTVAMARTTDVDSATSQFFVNLSNNAASLDSSSSTAHDGYAVFGQVLDMTTVDEIEALSVDSSNGSPYGELPVGASDQLAVIQAIAGQGEVTGVKFLDENANGIRDAGEPGIEGVSVYIDRNDNGMLDSGEISTTTDADGWFLLQVEPGNHTVRAAVSADRVPTLPLASDNYTVTVEIGRETGEIDFGEAVLAAPSDIDLLDATDSGTASDDDLTNYNNRNAYTTLQFEVSGVVIGAEVLIFSDGVQIGSAMASSNTVVITTDGLTTLADGTRNIASQQVFAGTTGDASDPLTVTVDTTPPAAIASTAPKIAQVGDAYTFDADSPDENLDGTFYSLSGHPDGMTIDQDTGVIQWTPSLEQAVPQEFEIRVWDLAGNFVSQAVDMTVLGVIPAYPDEYTVDEDSSLSVAVADGVLVNDGDQESGELSAVVVTQPEYGSLTFDPDGSFEYTPDPDFFGSDSFTYVASDETDDSNVAKVTIHVTGINDPPVPAADEYTLAEDTVLTTSVSDGVLVNDFDVDGDTLTTTLVDQATGGVVSLAADGTFSYAPDANFSGADSFTYTVDDGTVVSAPITVTLTITEVPDPPTAAADSYSVDEDGKLEIDAALGLLVNDSDPDSDSITASLATQPANGAVELNADGSFDYTPDADFYGVDTFTYVASDGVNSSAPATVSITVVNQPDPPTAVDDSFTAPNDGTAQTFDVLSNDTSAPDPSQTFSITEVTQGASGGTVTISAGKIVYKAPVSFLGEDTFTYTIEDSDGLTDTATVTVSVEDASDNALSGFVYIDHNDDGVREAGETGVPGVQITLTGTDNASNSIARTAITASDGSYLFEELPAGTYRLAEQQPAALVDGPDSTSASGAVTDDDAFSQIVLGNGQIIGENNFGEHSLRPEFVSIGMFLASTPPLEEYLAELIARAEELAGNTQLAKSIRAGITEVSYAGAQNDAYEVSEDETLEVAAAEGLLVNDSDADGDPINLASGVAITEINYSPSAPTTEELQVDSDFTNDDFEYIEIENVSDQPVDLTGARFTGGVTFDFTGSSVEELAPGETVLVVSDLAAFEARYGTELNVAGEFSGTLSDAGEQLRLVDALANSIHQFTYGVDDGWPTIVNDGGTLEVVDVTGDYDDPANWTASNDSQGTPGTGLATVVDFLMAELIEDPLHGLLTLNADGSFSYTPDDGFSGTDSFLYKLSNGEDESNQATVTIEVLPSSD